MAKTKKYHFNGNYLLSPRENPNFVGHEKAIKALFDSFSKGCLPHSWIISGPKGVGKASLAYRFSRFLLNEEFKEKLEKKKKDDPLWISSDSFVFKSIASNSHSDLLTIDGLVDDNGKERESIGIDDIRKIGRFFSKTSARSGWRIVIVDSLDNLTLNASNALLKNLEEPPHKALLLLISHNPASLLPTITSRCRKLPLSYLEQSQMKLLMGAYFEETEVKDKFFLSIIASGSIGYAIKLQELEGLDLYRQIIILFNTLPNLDIEKLHQFSDEFIKSGARARFITLMELLSRFLGQLIKESVVQGPKSFLIEKEMSIEIKLKGDLVQWLNLWDKVNELAIQCDTINLDPKQVLLTIFLGMEEAFNS